VVNKLGENGITSIPSEDFESVTARGVKGMFSAKTYYAGNRKFMEENGIRMPETLQSKASAWQGESRTVVYFASDETVIAVIAIADKIKSSSQGAVLSLQKEGIAVYMLTGDNEETAKAVAGQLSLK